MNERGFFPALIPFLPYIIGIVLILVGLDSITLLGKYLTGGLILVLAVVFAWFGLTQLHDDKLKIGVGVALPLILIFANFGGLFAFSVVPVNARNLPTDWVFYKPCLIGVAGDQINFNLVNETTGRSIYASDFAVDDVKCSQNYQYNKLVSLPSPLLLPAGSYRFTAYLSNNEFGKIAYSTSSFVVGQKETVVSPSPVALQPQAIQPVASVSVMTAPIIMEEFKDGTKIMERLSDGSTRFKSCLASYSTNYVAQKCENSQLVSTSTRISYLGSDCLPKYETLTVASSKPECQLNSAPKVESDWADEVCLNGSQVQQFRIMTVYLGTQNTPVTEKQIQIVDKPCSILLDTSKPFIGLAIIGFLALAYLRFRR